MAKQPKVSQTDYTRGGRDISNTAIPLYQQNLNQLGSYLTNVQDRLDPYLDRYVNLGQAAQQSDFLRDYRQAMGQATAGNYAATTGGYSSLNQTGYDDEQRYYNDLAARMYGQGLGQAADLAAQEWEMLAQSPAVFNSAYQLGKEYSDIQKYNDMAEKINDNWWSNALTSAGDTIGAISMKSGNPWVQAIGGSIGGTMGTAGRMTGYDSSALSGLRGAATGGTSAGQFSSGAQSNQANQNVAGGLTSLFGNFDWFNDNPLAKSGASGGNVGSNMASSAKIGNTTYKLPQVGSTSFKWLR